MVGDERPSRGPSGDGLHRRTFDLDEPSLRKHAAKRGNDLRAAEERAHRVGVAEEVDVPLAAALLDVGQAVPLLGRRQQALRQDRQTVGEDGDLARLGSTEGAIDADQVAEVEKSRKRPVRITDLVLADEDLDLLGPVADLEEDDLALTTSKHDPPGDAHPGSNGRGVALGQGHDTDLGDGHVVIEPTTPGVEPERGDLGELVAPDRLVVLARGFFRHRHALRSRDR